jgi:hypothetical protein
MSVGFIYTSARVDRASVVNPARTNVGRSVPRFGLWSAESGRG